MQETDLDMFNPGPHSPREFARMPICYLVTKSCLTPFSTPWSPPGSSVHGISQPSILEWVAISFPIACL